MTTTMFTGIAKANGAYLTHANLLLYGGAVVRRASRETIVTSTWTVEVVNAPSGAPLRVQGPNFAEDGTPIAGDPGWERVRSERSGAPSAHRYATLSRIRPAGVQ